MEGRLKKTEQKQQQIMNFLARAMQNPNFVHQLVQQKEWKKELEEALFSKKRRKRPIDQGPSNNNTTNTTSNVTNEGFDVKLEPDLLLDEDDNIISSDFEVSVSDFNLMSKMEEEGEDQEEEEVVVDVGVELGGGRGKEIIDEVFWEDLLLNDDDDECINIINNGDQEDVDVLAEQLGYLASSSK